MDDIHSVTQRVTGLSRHKAKLFLYGWIFTPDKIQPIDGLTDTEIGELRRQMVKDPEFHEVLFQIIRDLSEDINSAVLALTGEGM